MKVEDYIDNQRKSKCLSTFDIPNREDFLVKKLEEMMGHHTLPIHSQWDEVIWDRKLMVGSWLALLTSLFFRLLRPQLAGARSRIDSYTKNHFFMVDSRAL